MELFPEESSAAPCNQARARFLSLQIVPAEPRIHDGNPECADAFALALVRRPIMSRGLRRAGRVAHIVADVPRTIRVESTINFLPLRIRILSPVPITTAHQKCGVRAGSLKKINQAVGEFGVH